MMGWRKLGRIFSPEEHAAPWFASHAATPVVEALPDGSVRVYFSGRDARNRAQIGFFEIDPEDPFRVLRMSDAPVIPFGALGSYEDSGVIAGCLVPHESGDHFYYAGLTLGRTVPFFFFGGLAIREPGSETFRKVAPSPIMDRHPVDPFLVGQSFVRVEGGLWRMWYVSGVRWEASEQGSKHFYHIKYATSDDGVRWRRDGVVCIDFVGEEYAIAKPYVLNDGGLYKMWFCSRGPSYRIGYAESPDGIHWERRSQVGGLPVSDSGWDAEMTCYPYLLDHRGERYLFYNGNGYGRSGIGLAIWEGPR